jgi:hypothetical protein
MTLPSFIDRDSNALIRGKLQSNRSIAVYLTVRG